MVTQFYPPTIGGQERIVESLASALISRGHHVAVATLGQEGQPWCSYVSGVRVYGIGSTAGRRFRGYADPARRHAPPAVDPGAARDLKAVLRLERPDIVHGHDWLIHSFLPSKRREGPGLVVTLHDHSLVCANKRLIRKGRACVGPGPAKCLRCSSSYYGLAKGAAIATGNGVMSAVERALVDMFLPVSDAVAEAARLREHGNPYLVIPNFLPAPQAGDAEPREKPVDLPDEFVFFAGDLTHDKGVGVLLEAYRRLDDPPPLVLMGRLADPQVLAGRDDPPGSVRAVGPQPHDVVLDAFRRCTVAVVPSLLPEAFGLVALEAMAAGRPVIASNIGGLPEIVTDGEDGILVPPGDVDALQRSLARVLHDPAFGARIGAAAKRRAGDFAADRVVPRIEAAYDTVLTTRMSRATRQARLRLHPSAVLVLVLTALGVGGTFIPSGGWLPARAILVLPLLLFAPGYALTSAIFRGRPLGLVERVALTLSTSLVATALVSLVLDLTPFGLTLRSWTVALGLVTLLAVACSATRAPTALAEPVLALPRRLAQLSRRRVEIALVIAAAALVTAAVALARTPLSSPSAPGYTALWLTKAPHSAELTLGVRSEEHQRTRYVLRLKVAGHTTRKKFTLSPGQTWQERLPAARNAAASLHRVGHAGVYRSVHLGKSNG